MVVPTTLTDFNHRLMCRDVVIPFRIEACRNINNINHWNSMTDAERKARIDKMQAGRRRKQAEKQAEGNKLVDEWINNEFVYRPTAKAIEGIMKSRSLAIAKTNLEAGDIRMPDFAEQEERNRSKSQDAFNQVTAHRQARRLVTGIKEAALKEDSIEITADNEYVGISWLKLQSLVYKIMKEMDNE